MIDEARKTRAQYLNSLAVAVLTATVSAILANAVALWALLPAALISAVLHTMALRIVRK